MIHIDTSKTYGMESVAEVIITIACLNSMGYSDDEINSILDQSDVDPPARLPNQIDDAPLIPAELQIRVTEAAVKQVVGSAPPYGNGKAIHAMMSESNRLTGYPEAKVIDKERIVKI